MGQCLDSREWGPKVVRHGGDQRVLQPVRFSQNLGVIGLGGQANPFHRKSGVVCEDCQKAALPSIEPGQVLVAKLHDAHDVVSYPEGNQQRSHPRIASQAQLRDCSPLPASPTVPSARRLTFCPLCAAQARRIFSRRAIAAHSLVNPALLDPECLANDRGNRGQRLVGPPDTQRLRPKGRQSVHLVRALSRFLGALPLPMEQLGGDDADDEECDQNEPSRAGC